MMPEDLLFEGGRLVLPDRVVEGDLLVRDGRIAAIGPSVRADRARRVPASGLLLLPGFIDLHCHGGRLFDAMLGCYVPGEDRFDHSPAAFERGLSAFLRGKAAEGVTRLLAATVAAPLRDLRRALAALGQHSNGEGNGLVGSRLEGAFIEGSFILREDCAGAQNPAYFLAPSVGAFEQLDAAAPGYIRYVNIVPEHGAAGQEMARALSARGVLVGAGHTRCPADLYLQMVAAGLRIAVHFTNGPTGHSFKPFHGGDAVEAVLSCDALYAEIIADGYHVDPRYVLDILQRKGAERVVLVTDAVFPTGGGPIGDFTFAGIRGRASADGKYLRAVERENTLFGSVLTADAAFSNVLSWTTREMPGIWRRLHRPLALEDALVRTSRMWSANPADLLGLSAGAQPAGRLCEGASADLVLARLHGAPGAYRLEVLQTVVAGRAVYTA